MYVKIPKDIKEYKDRVILNLSWRQFISSALAFSVCIPLFYSLRKKGIDDDTIGWIVMFISMPLFGIGWFEYHGMSLEKYLYKVFLNQFIFPTTRKYKIETLEMEEYMNELAEERRKEVKVSKSRKGK